MLNVTIDLRGTSTADQLTGASRGFGDYLSSILSFVMVIAAVALLLFLIWGAIEWITSAGDNSKVQKARDKITQSVIGMIVLSATVAIFMFVQQFLGIDVLRFGGTSTPTTSQSQPVKPTPDTRIRDAAQEMEDQRVREILN